MENLLQAELTEFLRHYAMKDGDNIKQGGIYAATKAHLKNMTTVEAVEAEVKRMLVFGQFYSQFINPSLAADEGIRQRLLNIQELKVTTSYPLLLRLFDANKIGKLDNIGLEKCLGLIESFVVRRAVCGVPTNALNKVFTQWTKSFPDDCHAAWLLDSMSSGSGGRRYPTDTEFKDALERQPQYGRGTTRYILCSLEKSFEHKEPVDLNSTTIEHVLPQTLNQAWKDELGTDAEKIHAQLLDTFGNLTLTGYNPELGNIPFGEKKQKLQNTHVELNRWIIEQDKWRKEEITARAEILSAQAIALWPGPTQTTIA